MLTRSRSRSRRVGSGSWLRQPREPTTVPSGACSGTHTRAPTATPPGVGRAAASGTACTSGISIGSRPSATRPHNVRPRGSPWPGRTAHEGERLSTYSKTRLPLRNRLT